jgi:hypothetical protein
MSVLDGALENEGMKEGGLVPEGWSEKEGTADGLKVREGRRDKEGWLVMVGIADGESEIKFAVGPGVGFGVGAEEIPMQLSPFPVNPELHVQVKPPGVFAQEALALQGEEEHSLLSKHPAAGSPVNPVWQTHTKDAAMLTQFVLAPQGYGLEVHSSLSMHVLIPSPT